MFKKLSFTRSQVISDLVLQIVNYAIKSTFLNAVISKFWIFWGLKFIIDVSASSFISVKKIPYFNVILLALLGVSILIGFKDAFLLLLVYMMIMYFIFNFTEHKKKAASGLLMFLFYREDEKDLIRYLMFNLVFTLYLVWFLV